MAGKLVETGRSRPARPDYGALIVVKVLLSRRWATFVAPVVLLSAALPARVNAAEQKTPSAPEAPIVLSLATSDRSNVPSHQLAEDVTRRLRRMGINIMKTRLDNPYDPAGELC